MRLPAGSQCAIKPAEQSGSGRHSAKWTVLGVCSLIVFHCLGLGEHCLPGKSAILSLSQEAMWHWVRRGPPSCLGLRNNCSTLPSHRNIPLPSVFVSGITTVIAKTQEHPTRLCLSGHAELSQGGECLLCVKHLLSLYTSVISIAAVTVCFFTPLLLVFSKLLSQPRVNPLSLPHQRGTGGSLIPTWC